MVAVLGIDGEFKTVLLPGATAHSSPAPHTFWHNQVKFILRYPLDLCKSLPRFVSLPRLTHIWFEP